MVTVASLLQIMDYVVSLDSSRDLQPICVKKNYKQILFQIFDVMFLNVKFLDLNTANVCMQCQCAMHAWTSKKESLR